MGRILVRADRVVEVSGGTNVWSAIARAGSTPRPRPRPRPRSAPDDPPISMSAGVGNRINVHVSGRAGDAELWIDRENPRASLWVEYLESRVNFRTPVSLEAEDTTLEISAVLPIHLYTVDAVVPAPDGTGVEVGFRESPAIYFLHGTHERFVELREMLEREAASDERPKPRVLVTCQPTNRRIVDVEPAPAAPPPGGSLVGDAPMLPDTPPPPPDAVAPTPLTLSDALEAFDAVSAIDELNIPFAHPTDRCIQRAYLMCRLLRGKHIRSQKLWNYGRGYAQGGATLRFFTDNNLNSNVFWKYHVAPVVSVPSVPGGSLVFDPAMFPEWPVPVETWLRAQNDPRSDSFRSSDSALWRLPVTHEERVEQTADEFLPEVMSELTTHVRGWKERRVRLLLVEHEPS